MKTNKFKILTIALISEICICSAAYSQTNSDKVFFVENSEIRYTDYKSVFREFKNDYVSIPMLKVLVEINKITLTGDSLVQIATNGKLKYSLKINDIIEVSLPDGDYSGTGAWIGTIAGLLVGFGSGISESQDSNSPPGKTIFGHTAAGFACGLVLGIAIGSVIESTESYQLSGFGKNKMTQLNKILNTYKKNK